MGYGELLAAQGYTILLPTRSITGFKSLRMRCVQYSLRSFVATRHRYYFPFFFPNRMGICQSFNKPVCLLYLVHHKTRPQHSPRPTTTTHKCTYQHPAKLINLYISDRLLVQRAKSLTFEAPRKAAVIEHSRKSPLGCRAYTSAATFGLAYGPCNRYWCIVNCGPRARVAGGGGGVDKRRREES